MRYFVLLSVVAIVAIEGVETCAAPNKPSSSDVCGEYNQLPVVPEADAWEVDVEPRKVDTTVTRIGFRNSTQRDVVHVVLRTNAGKVIADVVLNLADGVCNGTTFSARQMELDRAECDLVWCSVPLFQTDFVLKADVVHTMAVDRSLATSRPETVVFCFTTPPPGDEPGKALPGALIGVFALVGVVTLMLMWVFCVWARHRVPKIDLMTRGLPGASGAVSVDEVDRRRASAETFDSTDANDMVAQARAALRDQDMADELPALMPIDVENGDREPARSAGHSSGGRSRRGLQHPAEPGSIKARLYASQRRKRQQSNSAPGTAAPSLAFRGRSPFGPSLGRAQAPATGDPASYDPLDRAGPISEPQRSRTSGGRQAGPSPGAHRSAPGTTAARRPPPGPIPPPRVPSDTDPIPTFARIKGSQMPRPAAPAPDNPLRRIQDGLAHWEFEQQEAQRAGYAVAHRVATPALGSVRDAMGGDRGRSRPVGMIPSVSAARPRPPSPELVPVSSGGPSNQFERRASKRSESARSLGSIVKDENSDDDGHFLAPPLRSLVEDDDAPLPSVTVEVFRGRRKRITAERRAAQKALASQEREDPFTPLDDPRGPRSILKRGRDDESIVREERAISRLPNKELAGTLMDRHHRRQHSDDSDLRLSRSRSRSRRRAAAGARESHSRGPEGSPGPSGRVKRRSRKRTPSPPPSPPRNLPRNHSPSRSRSRRRRSGRRPRSRSRTARDRSYDRSPSRPYDYLVEAGAAPPLPPTPPYGALVAGGAAGAASPHDRRRERSRHRRRSRGSRSRKRNGGGSRSPRRSRNRKRHSRSRSRKRRARSASRSRGRQPSPVPPVPPRAHHSRRERRSEEYRHHDLSNKLRVPGHGPSRSERSWSDGSYSDADLDDDFRERYLEQRRSQFQPNHMAPQPPVLSLGGSPGGTRPPSAEPVLSITD